MSNYPPGAFEALLAREKADARREKIIAEAEAELGSGTVKYVSLGRVRTESGAAFMYDWLDADVIEMAVASWLAGDKNAMTNHFESCCERAFEQAVEFLGDINE
jgi:hypothetical protein